MFRLLTLGCLTLALTACDQGPSMQEKLATAQSLQPSDPELNEIYQRSCRNCHTLESTGAPLTGDVHAWSLRLEKGQDVLLENVVSGFAGMPPFGLCMDCNVTQFNGLIEFMAQIQQQ
ncbi:MAG: cytochrome c5 family protein [Gammaproteobacteria bacterium]|nr:cytochrome c5 family protein [Gammaproteobacteria bacterium]